ncbi:protein mono-ADP-ribosyltransferase PARP9 [Grammomys surdaster]|uniref:protein mono-ADP-ribosyltransferase PARP9 n=1 Tax=Grammomys surdaster TaxID=491861 RepID=UPI0010A09394|nr:protein mono-ADP-ribosyltransferase PARP9 [Grammomys surdaster]XP_028608127.1 protein mono-ADP-ribosyltransferase PARP9 [Grammomys surdaster]XP_028608128.1 protein mono-ADP-ribosyltransferase PARP9 [Grammomys surdaster]
MAYYMGSGAAAPTERPADDSLGQQRIPIKHNVFEILKSKESQLCDVLQSKFGCVSTLSCPTLAESSSPAQRVFRRTLTPGIELSVWKDDLTRHVVDAVVNAANEDLLHGGGLAGSLVKAGGFEIQEESKRLIATYGKVPVGGIAVTGAGRLPCHLIIHAVGPRWTEVNSQTAVELLKLAIRNILNYVTKVDIQTVAIPALSSGIFQFPLDLCTCIILETIWLYFQDEQMSSSLREIHLVSNEDPTVESFKSASESILGKELSSWESPETNPSSSVTLHIGQGLTLQIVQGRIELQTTDVIVNSGYMKDFKTGCVAQSILKQAGLEMERELDKFYLSPDYQVVRVTKGFKLSCRYVFHVAWCSNIHKHWTLKDAMKSCLEKCLKPDINSISFPALGTGMIDLEKNTAAQIMFEEVFAFAKEHKEKTLTVKIVIFPVDVETYKVFCAEMTKRSNELNLSSNSGVLALQWTRGEQRRGSFEDGSPAINLMGVNVEDMYEAKEWIERLLASEDHHIIENNHILYLGKKEHGMLSELQTSLSVSISETVSPRTATVEIKGSQADLIEAVMKIECMLCDVQEEVAGKREKSLWSLSGQGIYQQGKLDEMEQSYTFHRYPVSLTQELQDREKQFEKCGLWVVKVEQIDNKMLLAAFQEKKKMMEERTLRGSGSQRLFQQVPHQFCNAVCRVGFHRLYSTSYDPVYGAGIYFTKSLKKLADKVRKTSNTDKLIYVFEAEVLTGSFCQGNFSNIIPPPLSPGALDVHDSVVDNVSNPETIVVFNGMQAVPRYLWTCTQDRTFSQYHMWSQGYSSGPGMVSSMQSWQRISNGSPV